MKKARSLLFPALLVLVFLFGCLGHAISKPPPMAESPYHVIFISENVNNSLLPFLPQKGESLHFGDNAGELIAVEIAPKSLFFREKGVLKETESSLFSTVSFTLSLLAHEREGRLYLGTRQLPLGENGLLCGQNFALSVVFGGIHALN